MRRLLPLIAVVLVAAACSGGGHSPSATTSVSFGPVTSTCGTAPPKSATQRITIDHRVRTVIVHTPRGYTDNTAYPLVLNLHGSGSTAAGQEAFSGMNAVADANGFIVAYPQALITEGTGFDWNIPGVPLVSGSLAPKGAADDIAFIGTLVQDLANRYCIDGTRVYVTGFSGGARMASQLGCDASEMFAAIGAVSGLRRPTPCPTGRPVPVIAFHGTADPVDPYAGSGSGYWTYSAPQAATYWATQDGCSTPETTTLPAPGVTLVTYSPCNGRVDVDFYTIAGEGHEWPGGPRMPAALTNELGPQSFAISADELMWRFFASHPLPIP